MKEGRKMDENLNETIKYKTIDIEEGLKNLINGELPEDKKEILRIDLIKQLDELKKILIDL